MISKISPIHTREGVYEPYEAAFSLTMVPMTSCRWFIAV